MEYGERSCSGLLQPPPQSRLSSGLEVGGRSVSSLQNPNLKTVDNEDWAVRRGSAGSCLAFTTAPVGRAYGSTSALKPCLGFAEVEQNGQILVQKSGQILGFSRGLIIPHSPFLIMPGTLTLPHHLGSSTGSRLPSQQGSKPQTLQVKFGPNGRD